MSYQIETSVDDDLVRVIATGEYAFADLPVFISRVREITAEYSKYKLLIDCSMLAIEMTEAERFAGGKQIAELFGPEIRVALLMPTGQVTKLGELAAVNRGAMLLVTSSEEEALEFLR
ncbi:MAG: hypothetical protein QM785_11465 [Pyrinomonadaceae bacterium]